MDSGASNPFSTPQAPPDPPADSGYLSPLPPYTPARLAIALGLISVVWVMVWLISRDMVMAGSPIFVILAMFGWLDKVTDPHSQRRGGNFKWYHMVLSIGGFVAFIAFLGSDKPLPPWLKELLMHPAALVLGWLVSCGLLLRDWWKRRNNPPYQPEPEANPAAFSRWKRMRRPSIRE